MWKTRSSSLCVITFVVLIYLYRILTDEYFSISGTQQQNIAVIERMKVNVEPTKTTNASSSKTTTTTKATTTQTKTSFSFNSSSSTTSGGSGSGGGGGGVSTVAVGGDHKKTLVHLYSPFRSQACEEPFCPYDQHQSITIASMKRALEKVTEKNSMIPNSSWKVELVAVTFPEDEDVIPSFFHHRLPPLNRSTRSVYPNLYPQKQLPFIQDMFDRLLFMSSSNNHHQSSSSSSSSPLLSFDYMIYTNSDIIVHEDFYSTVLQKIEEGYDLFTINRRTIPETKTIKTENNTTIELLTQNDLDWIYKNKGTRHHGHDCFVMKKRILQQVHMGNIFIGMPPFSNILYLQTSFFGQGELLVDRKNKVRFFRSKELHATYHLGDDQSWLDYNPYAELNIFNSVCQNLSTIDWNYLCMEKLEDIQSITIPCKWLLGKLEYHAKSDWKNLHNWCHHFHSTKLPPLQAK